jgi:probable HAF family extracellular repeat protein
MIIFAALIASFRPAAQAQANNLSPAPLKYTVKVLPGLGGLSGASSINNLGWVAGVSNPPGNPFDHALLWRDEQMTDLGTLGGYNSSVAFPNKNEIGWLVGGSETADIDPHQENFCQFICSANTNCLPFNQICKGFLWRSKTNEMIVLPPLPGGNNSYALGVNNQRQIVGAAENGVEDPNCVAPQVFRFEAVVWSLSHDGTPFVSQRLAPLAADTVSGAVGINERGEVVGASGPCVSIGPGVGAHAVLWKRGRAVDLGSLGGVTNNLAMAINSHGQVVGVSDLQGDNVAHAFLWSEGAMKDLGALRPDDTLSSAESINDRGEVVGVSCGPVDCRGFHWQRGVMTDVNSFLPPGSPLLITNAADINSRGEIAVQAFDRTVQDFVAAVLIPDGNQDGPLGATAQTENMQRKVLVLPQNIRQMLQRRIRFGHF